MNSPLPITERCKSILKQWRADLELTNLEKNILREDLNDLDEQLKRLSNKKFQISVFGRVGVGKSSLLNALLNKKVFATDISHGSTDRTQIDTWSYPIKNLQCVEVIDTPGIDEININSNCNLIPQGSQQSDLILFVLDSDLTSVELQALTTLLKLGKPIILVLNRCDQWESNEINQLKKSILARLPISAKGINIKTIAAAPRLSRILPNGKVRSSPTSPNIDSLRESLVNLLNQHGEMLLALNSLRKADDFYSSLRKGRLKRSKIAAQSLIGKFAAIKASSVAASPLLMLDLTTGLACDTALVIELSKLYGLQMGGTAARSLVKRVSIYNALLGGSQFSIQIVLGILRHILLLASPFTSGISLATAAPIALAQAAIAVHTTKLLGRLAAKELLRGTHSKSFQPRLMLRRLANKDPEVQVLLDKWPNSIGVSTPSKTLQTLLP